MSELIKVDYENSERPTVLGRDLHDALGINTKYADWFPRMCEYGFSEGTDYCSFLRNRSDGLPGRGLTDHQITIEMAKEICMIQRSEKGKQVRQYFIQLEKSWNTPEMVMARALKMADGTIQKLQLANAELEKQVELQKPKVLFADAVAASETSILIGDLAKILNQNGANIGQKRLFMWLRDNNYLIKQKGASYNMPTQKSMDLKLFEIKETVITHADGHTTISKTPKVTGKGQQYFINQFMKV